MVSKLIMAKKRKTDPPGARTRYRTDRLVEERGQWYFTTREGNIEGPYADKFKAIEALERYLEIIDLKLLAEDSRLSLESA